MKKIRVLGTIDDELIEAIEDKQDRFFMVQYTAPSDDLLSGGSEVSEEQFEELCFRRDVVVETGSVLSAVRETNWKGGGLTVSKVSAELTHKLALAHAVLRHDNGERARPRRMRHRRKRLTGRSLP